MDEATELSGRDQALDDTVPDTSHQSDISTKSSPSESSLGADPNVVEPVPQVDPLPTQMKMDVSSEPAEQSPVEDYSPHIVYVLEYKNIQTGRIIFTKEFNEPQAVQDNFVSGNLPVLEVITQVRSLQPADLRKDGEDAKLLQPPSVHSVAGTRLKINSTAIVTALKSVVEYYPGYSFLEKTVTIAEPYAILIHHEKELASYRKRFAPGTSLPENQRCERKRDTYEHLGILEKFLQDRMGPSISAEKQRHARGHATFEMLWMLYKPGTDVYLYHNARGLSAAVVMFTDEESRRRDSNVLGLKFWYMQYNGKYLGRERSSRDLARYDGEKEIAKLDVFPCQFLNEDTAQEGFKSQRTQIEERGKMFWRLTKKQCMHFTGLTATYPQEYVSQLLELGMSDLLTSPSTMISSWLTKTLISSYSAKMMTRIFPSLKVRAQPCGASQIASAVCALNSATAQCRVERPRSLTTTRSNR